MIIVIRVDASINMGTGHVMRCLVLAEQLRERGAKVYFISSRLPGNLCKYLESRQYTVFQMTIPKSWEDDAKQVKEILYSINDPIEWLIVDHYSLDYRWEIQMRRYVKSIMIIDDLANRIHDSDLLLDQNYYEDMESRYIGKVPESCDLFLGPRYVLLRKEFYEAREKLRNRDGHIKKILLFFGGSDPTNETVKALKAICLLDRADIEIDVVVGATNPFKEQVADICNLLPFAHYYCQVNNMAEMMNQADLAIGAGGSSTWERCLLGLPSIVVVVAQNQMETTEAIAKFGAISNLGWYKIVEAEDILNSVKNALSKPLLVKRMGKIALDVVGKESSYLVNKLLSNI